MIQACEPLDTGSRIVQSTPSFTIMFIASVLQHFADIEGLLGEAGDLSLADGSQKITLGASTLNLRGKISLCLRLWAVSVSVALSSCLFSLLPVCVRYSTLRPSRLCPLQYPPSLPSVSVTVPSVPPVCVRYSTLLSVSVTWHPPVCFRYSTLPSVSVTAPSRDVSVTASSRL